MKNIMIVDDNPEIVTLYRALFKRRGYNVLSAQDGTSALELLKEATPDLFILDVMAAIENVLAQVIREAHS